MASEMDRLMESKGKDWDEFIGPESNAHGPQQAENQSAVPAETATTTNEDECISSK